MCVREDQYKEINMWRPKILYNPEMSLHFLKKSFYFLFKLEFHEIIAKSAIKYLILFS